jgi:hypothetical protein
MSEEYWTWPQTSRGLIMFIAIAFAFIIIVVIFIGQILPRFIKRFCRRMCDLDPPYGKQKMTEYEVAKNNGAQLGYATSLNGFGYYLGRMEYINGNNNHVINQQPYLNNCSPLIFEQTTTTTQTTLRSFNGIISSTDSLSDLKYIDSLSTSMEYLLI